MHVIQVLYFSGYRMDWNRSKYIASRNVCEVIDPKKYQIISRSKNYNWTNLVKVCCVMIIPSPQRPTGSCSKEIPGILGRVNLFFFGRDWRVDSKHLIKHFYYTTWVFTSIPEELTSLQDFGFYKKRPSKNMKTEMGRPRAKIFSGHTF